MAKQRMVAGYVLQQDGVLTPNEPIKCVVNVPVTGTILDVNVDAQGNFVLFAEVWSHPEGTKINFEKHEYLIATTNKILPPGNWKWYKTIPVGPAIFHVYNRDSGPRIVQ